MPAHSGLSSSLNGAGPLVLACSRAYTCKLASVLHALASFTLQTVKAAIKSYKCKPAGFCIGFHMWSSYGVLHDAWQGGSRQD